MVIKPQALERFAARVQVLQHLTQLVDLPPTRLDVLVIREQVGLGFRFAVEAHAPDDRNKPVPVALHDAERRRLPALFLLLERFKSPVPGHEPAGALVDQLRRDIAEAVDGNV